MNELERLKQRVGLSQPTNLYSDRRLGTYQAYDDEEKKKQREIAETKAKIETLKEIENRDIPKQQMSIKSASDWGVNKYSKEFSQQLASDIEQTRAYGKGAGLSDKDIEDRLIPKTDGNSVKTRLSEIENKIKPGRENIAYQVQEGWMEKEVMNILSEEAVKEMNGLPNSRAEVDAFIASHPELQINEDANLVDKGIRFIGDLSRMSRDSAEYAVKDKESWLVAGAVLLGGTALTVATGGAALPIFATTLGASLATLTPLAAAGLGMSYGGLKKMAELETGLAYNEYLNEGVHPEIAKNIASTVGAINGVLEMAEIGTILTGVPGANVVAGKAMDMAKSELQKKAIRAVAAYGVNLASNALEEMAQESNTMLGLELSKYLQDAPNPNTMDGLRVLANTMTTEEYRDRVAESGLQAIQSMWLVPIGTSVARTGIRSAVADMEAKAQQKAAKGWYDEKDRQTNEYINKQKEIILSDDGAIDTLAGKVTNDRDATSYATLISMEPFLDDIINRKDLTNEEREILIQKSNVLKEAIASVQFDAKSENNNINLKPTSMEEVTEIVLAGQAEHSNIENGTYIERYKEARELNLIDKVKTMRAEGRTTSEIADAIQKSLPKKRRNAVEANLILSSIEKVEQAAKQQRNLNLVSNFDAIKPTLNRNEPSESSTTNETNVGDTNTQPQAENANMDSVVPQDGIEVEEATQTMANEVKTETIEPSTLKNDTKPSEEVRQKYESADVVKVPVSEINIDPQRFQFRFEGTTDKLVGAKWNDNAAGTVLLWENEYQDLYVVNGHHRVQLAKDNNVETLDAKILKGVTAEEARAEGAFRNIAEGSATSIDVAKYMRDTGTTLKDMQEYGIAPKSKIARDGEALANLDDFIFKAVATRQFPVEKGIIIGREFGKDKAAQRGFLVALQKQEAKGKNITNDVMQEMIAQEKGMAQETFTEQTMFGTVEDRKSLTVERAELVAYTKGQLKSRVSLLKNVSKEKNAKILESLGNKVDKDVNFREMEVADQALELLNITLNQQGTIANRMFNEFAREYAQADNKEAVKKKALNAFIEAMESGAILEEAFGKKTASEAIVEAITEELEGQGDLFGQFAQIKEMRSIKVVAKHGTDQATYDKLIPLIELMEKNPMFNGLEIVFTGQASTKVMTRSELDAKGYYNAKPGRYTTYGWYESRANSLSERDNAERTDQGDSARDQLRNNRNTSQKSRGRISLNNSAQVDTLLHEAIHSIQDILYRVDPEFEVLVKDWEEQVQDLAREQGIALPQGREMLTHALMLGEFGYANDDFNLAKAVEVPTEIVRQFKAMLGKDFIRETMGNVQADTDRAIKAEFKKLADINLTDAELAKSIARAKERRLNKIKMDLRARETIKYYSPDSTTYAIAVPKDTNYEVSFFNEQGLLTKAEMGIDKLAKKLSDMKLYYNPGEISYQLKQFDRAQIDEVVTGNDLKDISNIVRAFENARVGNFTASDYDNFVKGKLNEADSQDLLKAIMNSAEKGLDKPNSEVTIQEYVNRFYPQKMESNDYGMRERDGKIEFFYKAYDEMSPYRSDEIVPIKVLGTFDSVTEAIKTYRDWTYLNRDLSTYKDKAFNKQFYYMPDYWDQLVQEYEDFKANYETYRHDYSTDFDGQPKFNVSYQIKKGLSDTKRINPEAGEILTVVYKGFKDGEAKRIKTGNSQWDSFFFVADNPLDASLYGNTLEEYSVSPKAKILYEGTKEFSAISKHKKNETMLEWSSRIANIAKEQGYDAVWFKRQGEIGTAIINRDILDLPSERINYQVKQVADINTEEFKKWFGNSQVVDAEGKPLIVYHGSPNTFEVFDNTQAGNRTGNFGWYGKGFYFTSIKYLAKQYGDNVHETYLSIQKPFVIDNNTDLEIIARLAETDIYDTSQNVFINMENMIAGNEEVFTENLQKQGYDGVIVNETQDFQEVVVFNPTQIKSIYNNGQFSLYDPNINYQLKQSEDGITQYSLGNINNFVEAEGNKSVVYSDAVDLFNNKVLSVKGDIPDRLMPFIKYNAVMGGYDAIAINGEEPVMITRDEILEIMSKRQPLFQLKGELMAVHNIGEGQLLSAMKLGGLPMASIAITKTDYNHNRYGEVSLLFNKNTIDPRLNKANRVYSGDAYTPTFPQIVSKVNENVADAISEKIGAMVDRKYRDIGTFRTPLDADNIADRIDRRGSFKEAYKDNHGFKLAYLKDKGVEFEPIMTKKKYKYDYPLMEELKNYFGDLLENSFLNSEQANSMASEIRNIVNEYYRANAKADDDSFIGRRIKEGYIKDELGFRQVDDIFSNVQRYARDDDRTTIDAAKTVEKLDSMVDEEGYDKWLDEISEGIIETQGIRNNKDLFTSSGNRRNWNTLHDPVTLDNILRSMMSEDEKASGWWGGIGEFGAAASNTFKSITEIKENAYRLTTMDEAEYQAIRDEFNTRLTTLAHKAAEGSSESNPFIASGRAMTAMTDAVKTSKTKEGIKKILGEYRTVKFTDEMVDEVIALAQEVAQMPTEYFEAKPRRIIYFNEVQAAVIPITASETLIQALRQNGIHVLETYDPAIEGDRQRAMNELLEKKDVSFQIKQAWEAEDFDEYYQMKDNADMEEMSWSQTVRDANITSEWLKEMLTDRKMMYEVAHNKDTVIAGAKILDEKGIDYVEARLKSDLEATADLIQAGMTLIYYYQESGDKESAYEMTAIVAKKVKTAGQAIQILSMLNKESPEGMLRFVRREFDKSSTSRQRKMLDTLTQNVEEALKQINSDAVDNIDLTSLVKQIQDMTQEEMDKLEISQSDQKTQDFLAGKEVETTPKSNIDPNVIIEAIRNHYKGDGNRSLAFILRQTGLNNLEAKMLSEMVEAEMLKSTDAKMQETIDRLVPGKAKAVDKSIKDLVSKGRYGEALKLRLGQKKGIPVMTQEISDMVYKRAKEISEMPQGRQRDVELAKLIRDIDETMPMGIAGKITTFRVMMMLLNGVTMLRNIYGNLGFGTIDTFAVNVLGAHIDKLFARHSGFRTTMNIGFDIVKKQFQGYKTGFMTGYEEAKMGIDTTRDINRMELGKTGRAFKRGTFLGWLETWLNIGLRATDRGAASAAYLSTITEQMAIAEVAEPTQEMIDIAQNLGLYRTFNDDTMMSEAFGTVKQTLNMFGTDGINKIRGKSRGGGFGFGDVIMPFTKTVANIVARAIDYTPAGVIATMAKLHLDHSQSDYVRQRMKVEALSRSITGSTMIATGMILANLGILFGGEPEDEDKDIWELQEQAGFRPYTINLSALSRLLRGEENATDLRPKDQLATYDWFQPSALTIAIGADAVTGTGDTFNLINSLVRAVEVGTETVTNQPLIQNITRFFAYGINKGFTNTLKQLPASFIPSVMGRIAQAADGGATDPYSYFSEARQAWNLIVNKVPGDGQLGDMPLGRGAIPDKIDIMGNPIEWYGTDNEAKKFIQALTSPSIRTEYNPTKEMQFLMDLTERTGDSGIIAMPQKTFTQDGKSYVPTAEQYEAMSIYYGKALQQDISRLMEYGRGRDDEWLAKEVKSIVTDIKGEIKYKFIRGDFN